MNPQDLFQKLTMENILIKVKNVFLENLLIKAISFIITLTLFLVVKTELFNMESLVFKKVPVIKQIVGTPPDGFTAIVSLTPNKVDVYGPYSRVKDVKEFKTEVINLSTIKTTITKDIKLDLETTSFYTVEPKEVKAFIQIQEIK
ncbi:MAG: YbbR-like domain-containing protein [Deltaproteobacteria bacterium]|nr:YbbR-like domain-containing protein [Deltaproteobacteria bacterium]